VTTIAMTGAQIVGNRISASSDPRGSVFFPDRESRSQFENEPGNRVRLRHVEPQPTAVLAAGPPAPPSTGPAAPFPDRDKAASRFQRDLIALVPYLHNFARALCGNRALAEDIAQEALAKAWRARGRFDPGTNLKAWLFTILRNEFYDHARRARREAQWDEQLAENIPAPAHKQERAMNLSDTARALGALPERQREAVILVAVGGFTCDNAARLCGTSAGTIKSRVKRGRARLSKFVDGEEMLPRRSAMRATDALENILEQLTALSPTVGNRAAHA